jgi:hypothetical protein
MTAAMLLALLRRRAVDVILLGGLVVGFFLLLAFYPWALAIALWSFLLIPALVHAFTHDTGGDGEDR